MHIAVTSIERESRLGFSVKLELTSTPFGTVTLGARVDATSFSTAAEEARLMLVRFASELEKASEVAGSFG